MWEGVKALPQKVDNVNKSVAIVGTHPTTREQAPYQNKDIDIWTFNNQILQGWCPRADAVFDIHQPDDIYRRSLEHPAFGQWLKAEKGLTFYTPTPLDVPNNEVYPLDNIVKTLLPNFKRGDEINKYFTSGPCYAIALAIYLGYENISMYGIEMEANSEYIYQRDGIGLWFGIALGRGITVQIPRETMMFYAPLYGFDDNANKMDRETFETRATEIQEVMIRKQDDLSQAKGHLDSVLKRIQEMQTAGTPATETMAIATEFEDCQHAYEQAIADFAFMNGQYVDCRAWQVRIEKHMEYSGKAHEVLAQRDDKWSRMTDKAELMK
jgi:hypothetical protein